MSTNNRITKVTRSVKNIFGSVFQPFRAATPPSIDSDVENSRTLVTDAGVVASNVPIDCPSTSPTSLVPMVTITSPPEGAEIVRHISPPISAPISPSIPDLPGQLGSGSNSRPETPHTDLSPPNANSPVSLFQNAQNVYMHSPTFIVTNSVHNVSSDDHDRIINASSEELLPRVRMPASRFNETDNGSDTETGSNDRISGIDVPVDSRQPMLKPPAGTYYIVNKTLSSRGEQLAITYAGEGHFAIVTPLTHSTTQQWIIADFYDGRTQSVTPVNARRLQAGWGSSGVIILPACDYVWTIRGNGSRYTIQDGGVTVFWGLESPVNNSQISIGEGIRDEGKHWILQNV